MLTPPGKIYGQQKTVIGPGDVDLDMYPMKTIPMGERVATQLRWEVFNVANHPIFALPNGTLNSTAFGTIPATKSTAGRCRLQQESSSDHLLQGSSRCSGGGRTALASRKHPDYGQEPFLNVGFQLASANRTYTVAIVNDVHGGQ